MIFAHGGKDTQKPWEGGCPGGCAAHPELQVARTPFRLKEARRGASHCAADHRATKCARDEHVQHTRLCQEALKAIRRLRLASRLMPWRWATLSLALADCHVDVDPAEIFGWKGGGIDRLRFFKARAPMTHIEVYDGVCHSTKYLLINLYIIVIVNTVCHVIFYGSLSLSHTIYVLEEEKEKPTGEVGLCTAAHRGHRGSCWELEPRGPPGAVEVQPKSP